MFADISGSSPLYKQLGDNKANFLIQKLLSMMTNITTKHHGKVIKTIGDEVMTCFDKTDSATEAAREMQDSCRKFQSNMALKLRIGIDTGGIICEHNDLFGETVNNAAYLTGIAKSGKILLSKNAFNSLNLKAQKLCYEYDNVVLKGHTLKTKIFRMHWEQKTDENFNDATVHMGIQSFTRAAKLNRLELTYQSQKYILTTDMEPFTIGRNTGISSLFISNSFVSRDHCQIIFRRGKFILCDTSTNGTYVTQNNQREIYLRREELPLTGQGIVSIGQSVRRAGDDVLGYTLKV
ncbi:adenylate/guanylate cyclase domain-containing protein [Gammaproteobacteria bacterium AH-315-E17]|nr:adenylate/guanylate cyclase domain-containing protein [Gammaproteobacteria bacterium AH-315-E17]